GTPYRRFLGPPYAGRRNFAFVANDSGTYQLEAVAAPGCCPAPAPSEEPARAGKYELELTGKISQAERLRPLSPAPRTVPYAGRDIEELRMFFFSGAGDTE